MNVQKVKHSSYFVPGGFMKNIIDIFQDHENRPT